MDADELPPTFAAGGIGSGGPTSAASQPYDRGGTKAIAMHSHTKPRSGRQRDVVPRRPSALRAFLFAAASACLSGSLPAPAALVDGPLHTESDDLCDIRVLPTDPDGDTPFDTQLHPPIDLLEIAIGAWAPALPSTNLFEGAFVEDAAFVRFDIRFDGVVNPPGSVDPLNFAPFAYGDSPLYGFVEIDVDGHNDTGGEVDAPQYRYLANVARFGGVPHDDEFDHRVATNADAFDGDFTTEPFIERHGEEFHLAFLGGQFSSAQVTEWVGNGDLTFSVGETWTVIGDWFDRAHGFEPFSLAVGGLVPGEYTPETTVRFEHDPISDTTLVSLVFPLTNAAAAIALGEPVQTNNGDASDHASIEEGLRDLVDSATLLYIFPTGQPEEALIIDWKDRDADDHLDPTEWRYTALFGSSYTEPDLSGAYFIWNDIYPNVDRGDINGENGANADDADFIAQTIVAEDALDGVVDGVVTISGFPALWRLCDVNQDGGIDEFDALLARPVCDNDDDEDVDLADFQSLQNCLSGGSTPFSPPECTLSDYDVDHDVDRRDFKRFLQSFTGPDPSGLIP